MVMSPLMLPPSHLSFSMPVPSGHTMNVKPSKFKAFPLSLTSRAGELGMWRPARFKMRDEYITEYFNHFPKTPPEEDWDDRNLLYSL